MRADGKSTGERRREEGESGKEKERMKQKNEERRGEEKQ